MRRLRRLPRVGLLLVSVLVIARPAPAQDSTAAPADSIAGLLEKIAGVEARIEYLRARFESAEGEDRDLFEYQIHRRWTEHHGWIERAVELTEEAREAGTEDPAATAGIRDALAREVDFLSESTGRLDEKIRALRIERPDAPAAKLFGLEAQLSDLNEQLDELLAMATDDLEWAQDVGLDLGLEAEAFDLRLAERAATTAARIELAMDQRSRLRKLSRLAGADTVQVRAELNALDEKIRGTTATLQATVRQLDRRGAETARYKTLLLESSGDLGTEALNPEVVSGLLEERWAAAREWLEKSGGRLLVKSIGVVLVLVLFGLLARLSRRLVGKILSTSKVTTTELLRRLFTGAASKLVWLIGFLIALSMVGVDVGPMLAGLGIAGFVLGFALQDTLSNFAAGMMIMFYHPFDVGDVVTAGGVTGKVESVTLVSTVIGTFDNQVIIVPNNKVWGDVITNVTAQKTRRVDLTFGIGYGDDIPKAQRIMEDVLAGHELVLDDPEPVVRVFELADSSVNFICRPWCRTEDYWTVYWDVTEAVKLRFDAEGVTIPFPQRDVHLYRQSPAAGEEEG